jgi:hypothetical protein
VGGGGLDDYGIQIPTVATDIFYGGYSRTFDACTSILSLIILTDKDFD